MLGLDPAPRDDVDWYLCLVREPLCEDASDESPEDDSSMLSTGTNGRMLGLLEANDMIKDRRKGELLV
jgi:hypothetical protein